MDAINQDVNIKGEGNIVVGQGDVIINPLPPAEARLRHDLGILLKNVETTWIKGVLEKSVHEAALLQLGMELREEAVDNPWNMVIEDTNQKQEELPRGRKTKDIFNEANRLLLILGEPGSGKTTTLLQLARDLIAEVDETFTQPVPIILNLSTWTNKQQPLVEWMVAELSSKYRLPKKDGKRWLNERRLLPLLDGLDEVKIENRVACVNEINQLIKEYGLQGVAVCSRIKDYMELNVRLEFYRAIYIEPLTVEEVDEYLANAGEKLASLRAALQGDESLQNLAQSPLILNIMSLAYQNTSAEALRYSAVGTNEARRKHLFDVYIDRMFKRKVGIKEYDPEQTKQHLSWLARNMQLYNQDVFLMEALQPSWLQTRRWRLMYTLASRLFVTMTFGLAFGLLFGLSSDDVAHFLEYGLIRGLIFGFIASIIDTVQIEWFDKLRNQKVISHLQWSVIYLINAILFSGLVGGLMDGWDSWFVFEMFALIVFLPFWLRGIRKILINGIQTVESLSWHWNKALKGMLFGGLIGGLCVGLFTLGTVSLPNGESMLLNKLVLSFALNVAYLGMFFFGFIGAIFSGLTPGVIETKATPNQGIQLSAKNSLYSGSIVTLCYVGLVVVLFFIRVLGDGGFGMAMAPLIFLGIVLSYGGFDVIQHYTLRLILIIQGHTPRDYTDFLDYAVDHIFLQKVGGGYRFIHRMLLEHFAEMHEPEKKA